MDWYELQISLRLTKVDNWIQYVEIRSQLVFVQSNGEYAPTGMDFYPMIEKPFKWKTQIPKSSITGWEGVM